MSSWIEKLKQNTWDNGILPIALELNRVFPESILIMSGIFAFLTLSYPFAVLFGSLLEATVIFHLLRNLASYIQVVDLSVLRGEATPMCQSGFSSRTLNSLSLFASSIRVSFPSAPLFMLSTASAYTFMSIYNQQKEIEALGPTYSSRYYMSMIFLFSLIFVVSAFRLTYSCDSFGVVLATIPIGLAIGTLLVNQNSLLFGPESVNLLGIPLLKGRTTSGKKLYVCPGQSKK